MGADADPDIAGHEARAAVVAQLVEQCARLKLMLEECSAEFAAVNGVVRTVFASRPVSAIVGKMLEKGSAAEEKLVGASELLVDVGRLLELAGSLGIAATAPATARADAPAVDVFHDALTGLANDTLFRNRLVHGLQQATRRKWTLAVMSLELAGFRAINVAHGRGASDEVLRTIARRIRENTRGEDTVSRRGDDAFLYLLMDFRDETNIAMIAEKLIRVVKAPCEFSIAVGAVASAVVELTIGVAMFPADGSSVDALIASADKALTRASRRTVGYSFLR